jgi:hypothetical protein
MNLQNLQKEIDQLNRSTFELKLAALSVAFMLVIYLIN